jgi:putative aminopeptidase FrvX
VNRKTHWRRFVASAMVFFLCLWQLAEAQGLRYSRVSREVVEGRLGKYDGDNKRRETALKQIFSDAGCDEHHLSEQAVKDSKQPNVICVLPGTSGRTIIVGAHFDRVASGDGVVDNWSGASLLASLYESLKTLPHTHSYIFIGFTSEEAGEIGSHFYVQKMTKEEVDGSDAMVNMDTLGLGPTQVWGSHSDTLLIGSLGYVAKQLNVPVSIVDVDQVGSTDSEQFAARKIPRITVHSLTQKTWEAHIIHTSKDKISAMQLDNYYQTYGLLAAYLAFLDQMPNRQQSTRP